jgi:hypothetical protein
VGRRGGAVWKCGSVEMWKRGSMGRGFSFVRAFSMKRKINNINSGLELQNQIKS